MRFLFLVSLTVVILAAATVLVIGYIDGEFEAPGEGLVWLLELIEGTLT
jgi:hypothetical protein